VSDQEQARRVLGFPDGYFCAYLIGLGYPADRRLRPLVRPDRRAFDEVVHWDRW
jgi:nitroreductase